MSSKNTNNSNSTVGTNLGAADAQALLAAGVQIYAGNLDSQEPAIDPSALASLQKPTHVIVSRFAPGYRIESLDGDEADDGIARILASKLTTAKDIAEFGLILKSGQGIPGIVKTLLPRSDVPLKGRASYSISESMVSRAVDRELSGVDSDLRACITYVLTKVFEEKKLIIRALPKNVAAFEGGYVASVETIINAAFIEKMRGVFDGATIKRWASRMEEEITPNLLAERIIEMLQGIADVLPTVARDYRYVSQALAVLRAYVLNPTSLPIALAGNEDLVALSRYSNLMLHVVSTGPTDVEDLASEVYQLERALSSTLKLIAGASTLEVIALEKFVSAFYRVPAMAAKGEARGMVIGRRYSQVARHVIVEAVKEGTGYRLTEQEPADNRGSALAPLISGHLTSEPAFVGTLNLLADTLSRKLVAAEKRSPELWTFQMTPDEVTVVAIASARSLMVLKTRGSKGGTMYRLVYTIPVKGDWRETVSSSTGSEATFNDPVAAILYSYDMEPVNGSALPMRDQTLKTAVYSPKWFVNDISSSLSYKIAKPFNLKLVISGRDEPLSLEVSALTEYMKTMCKLAGDKAPIAYVREPGVDDEVRNLFAITAHLMRSGDVATKDRAASWLIEQTSPLWSTPLVSAMAALELTKVMHAVGWDLRLMPTQQREVMSRVLIGVLLALLERHEKVAPSDVEALVSELPVSTLTAAASASISKMQQLMTF